MNFRGELLLIESVERKEGKMEFANCVAKKRIKVAKFKLLYNQRNHLPRVNWTHN